MGHEHGKKGGPLGSFKVKIQDGGTDYYLVAAASGTQFTWTSTCSNATTFDGGTNDGAVSGWTATVGGTTIYLGVSGTTVQGSTSTDTNWQAHTSGNPVKYVTTSATNYLNRDSGGNAILSTTNTNVTRK